MAATIERVICRLETRIHVLMQRSCNFCTTSQDRGTAVWTQKIDHNLELRAIKKDGVVQHARPLLLLFGWMRAKRKHMQKYEEFYINRGYNVLTVSCAPVDILKPVRAQGIASKILGHIDDRSQNVGRQPVLLHGFSVGGYLIAEFHVKLNTENNIARDLIVAQVLDSPVDFDGIPMGFSTALTNNPALRFLIRNSLHLYMKVFRTSVSNFFKASEAFKYNKYRVPSLFFYSKADSVATQETVEGFIDRFNQREVPVQSKCWLDSPHVSHYYYYPREYTDILSAFLDKYDSGIAGNEGPSDQEQGEGQRKLVV